LFAQGDATPLATSVVLSEKSALGRIDGVDDGVDTSRRGGFDSRALQRKNQFALRG